MFSDKTKKPTFWDPAQDKKLSIENVPVHSMNNDMTEIKNPGKVMATSSPEKPISSSAKKPAAESQPTSPFANQPARFEAVTPIDLPVQPAAPVKSVAPAAPVISAPKSTNPWEDIEKFAPKDAQKSTSSSNLGKIFTFIGAFILLFAIGFGGYYFWLTRIKNIPVAISTPIETPVEPAPVEPEQPVVETFSSDKPNYFPIDTQTANSASIKSLFAEYVQKTREQKLDGPLEFVVTDAQNNPISFSDFATKSGITFSPELMARLNNDFSLYIYNDNTKYRLGLSVSIKNADGLQAIMRKEEAQLPTEIQPLFLADQFAIEIGKTFSTGTLNNAPEIRYVNITSPEDLSVDYTIDALTPTGAKLLIGTTKMTLRSLVSTAQKGQ